MIRKKKKVISPCAFVSDHTQNTALLAWFSAINRMESRNSLLEMIQGSLHPVAKLWRVALPVQFRYT